MANPRPLVTCPRSKRAWLTTVRRQKPGAPVFTTSCPSCGQGLTLVYGNAGQLVIKPTGPMAAMHLIVAPDPIRLPLADPAPTP